MYGSPSSPKATAPFPDHTLAIASNSAESPSIQIIFPVLPSASPSSSQSEQSSLLQSPRLSSRPSRMDRPRLGDRQRSSSIIIPKGRDVIQRERPEYPSGDARAMSPRRNSRDIERLERGVRESLKEQAQSLQSSLAALADKIDAVKSEHDKLENENRFLQDYIGGLARTMTRDNHGRSPRFQSFLDPFEASSHTRHLQRQRSKRANSSGTSCSSRLASDTRLWRQHLIRQMKVTGGGSEKLVSKPSGSR